LIYLTGCTHYYYLSNVQNIPMFREKKEYRFSVNAGGGDQASSSDINAAYSITNKFAIMFNYMQVKAGNEKGNTNFASAKYYEAAFGYYKPLNKYFVFETYIGLANCKQHHQYSESDLWSGSNYIIGTSDLIFTKFFIQPSIGAHWKAFDCIVSTRLTNLNFTQITNNISQSSSEFANLNLIEKNRNTFLTETSLTIRVGFKNLKLQMQGQGVSNLTHTDLKFINSQSSIGLIMNFSNNDLKNLFKRRKVYSK